MYADLFKHFETIAKEQAKRVAPQGFDVAHNAPQTLADCRKYFDANGTLCVSKDNDADTIYESADGNQCFRAWHDTIHLKLNAEFDRVGEYAVFLEQSKDIRAACDDPERVAALINVLRCEILGQFDYKQANGTFPQYQRAFTIDYLEGRH